MLIFPNSIWKLVLQRILNPIKSQITYLILSFSFWEKKIVDFEHEDTVGDNKVDCKVCHDEEPTKE